jgi:demethoxyubiquinone hydroxylase (CLK1/Coq7/Cat5 family)
MRPRDTIAILRVNHGGEHGAIAIYCAQLAVARGRCPELRTFRTETLSHECEHRQRFAP